jgi:hypothetical protein
MTKTARRSTPPVRAPFEPYLRNPTRTRFVPDVTTRGHISAARMAVHIIFVYTACRRNIDTGVGMRDDQLSPRTRAYCRLQ